MVEKKKIPPELARAIASRTSMVETSTWFNGDVCCTVKHLACGKSYTTEVYRKRETAERSAKRWFEKHLTKCRATLEADAAFYQAKDAREKQEKEV